MIAVAGVTTSEQLRLIVVHRKTSQDKASPLASHVFACVGCLCPRYVVDKSADISGVAGGGDAALKKTLFSLSPFRCA